MNKEFLSGFEKDPANNQPKANHSQENIHPNSHEMNTSEGSEFLDDALRMEDLQWDNSGLPPDEISLYVSHPIITEKNDTDGE